VSELKKKVGKHNKKGIDPCNCIQNLTVYTHGKSGKLDIDGTMFGGDWSQQYAKEWNFWNKYKDSKREAQRRAAEESMKNAKKY
jgi:hypothetical protein